MSMVDWSLAPEGSTHYNYANYLFYRFSDNSGDFWCANHGEWCAASLKHEYTHLIERQKHPQAWPDDGLPPIGAVCEAMNIINETWHEVKVIDHMEDNGVCAFREAGTDKLWWSQYFRQLKTTEQQAADRRETAIRELMDIAQVDCRVTAARLVDAGFKREGV